MATSFLSAARKANEEEEQRREDRRQASWEARVDWEDWLQMREICEEFIENRMKEEEFWERGYESEEEMWNRMNRIEKNHDGWLDMIKRCKRFEQRRMHAA